MEGQQPQGFFDGNPKMIFAFGLMTGIALTMLFGGGVKIPSFADSGSGSDVVRTFDTDDEGDSGSDSGSAGGTLAAVSGDEHIIGGDLETAKVVMVEYSDFECPFCSRHLPSIQQALEDFGDDIVLVYRHFPLSFHPEAEPAALASECAAEQGEFWAFHDGLFENQSSLGDDLYAELAGDIGLNVSEFTDCYESEKFADAVDEDYRSGGAAGVSGTPATYINGQLVSGAVPYDTLKDMIQSIIDG